MKAQDLALVSLLPKQKQIIERYHYNKWDQSVVWKVQLSNSLTPRICVRNLEWNSKTNKSYT